MLDLYFKIIEIGSKDLEHRSIALKLRTNQNCSYRIHRILYERNWKKIQLVGFHSISNLCVIMSLDPIGDDSLLNHLRF